MIESPANPRIKAIRRLHRAKHRRAEGLTIVEGRNGLKALASSAVVPEVVLCLSGDGESKRFCADRSIDRTEVTQTVLDAASDTKNATGPVAVIATPAPKRLRGRNTIALVDISDPGNVGTIIRTATGFGWDVSVYGSTADPWSPKALRSAAATTIHAHLSQGSDPTEDAKEAELVVVALVVAGGDAPQPGTSPRLVCVGSEAHGLPRGVVDRADIRVTIPATSVESLNAATASAIAMYAMRS